MRFLARLIISLDKLFKNHIIWVVIPVVSVISILSYIKITNRFQQPSSAEVSTYQAIQNLKEEIKELHQDQLEELANIRRQFSLSEDDQLIDLETDNLSSSSGQTISLPTNFDPNDTTLKLLYINKDQTSVDLYEQPSLQAKKIEKLPGDAIYFYRSKEDGWYQIELENKKGGWIQQKFVLELP